MYPFYSNNGVWLKKAIRRNEYISIFLMVYLEVTVDLCYFVYVSVPFLAEKA